MTNFRPDALKENNAICARANSWPIRDSSRDYETSHFALGPKRVRRNELFVDNYFLSNRKMRKKGSRKMNQTSYFSFFQAAFAALKKSMMILAPTRPS